MNDRMCIICKKRIKPTNLIKITKVNDQILINSNLQGRSCYLEPSCLNLLKIKKGRFIERSLKVQQIPEQIFEELSKFELK